MQSHHRLTANVANHHLARQQAPSWQLVTITIVMMAQVSEYYSDLSAESTQKYTDKVSGVGLRKDPYAIPSEFWQTEPNQVPNVAWSDMFVQLFVTLSAYTKE